MRTYTDVRTLLDDYERHDCPHCARQRWFSRFEWDGQPNWRCQHCRKPLYRALWIACPGCGGRMIAERDPARWYCRVCGGEREMKRDALIDRLSSDAFMTRGMPGVSAGDCPLCGADRAIDGGPDGELECSECRDFYAGQYSDMWFAYAEWLKRRGPQGRHETPGWIRTDA